MYEHRYKHGKQKGIMPLAAFQTLIEEAANRGAPLNHLAFCIALWHTGVRKSELYERLLSDVTVTENFVVVDFHKRKKGGDEVPPLKIPRSFFGVEEYLVPWIERRKASKPPPRKTWKNLFYQMETEKTRVTAKGKTVTVKKRVKRKERGLWLFPNVGSTTAWQIVKDVLGAKYYPHYLRLRKLSKIASNPKTKSIIHIKSVSGLKSITAIQAYMGVDEELQDEAMRNE